MTKKLDVKEYNDEDLEIVIESLKIHEIRITNIESKISEICSQIKLLKRLKAENFKFEFPITTHFAMMDLDLRLAEPAFYDLFVVVISKKYPSEYSKLTKLGFLFSDKLLSSYDYNDMIWMAKGRTLQKRPLRSFKVIDALRDALLSLGKVSSKEEFEVEFKQYWKDIKDKQP